MAKKHDHEFKVRIVELLNSGIKTKQVSEEYNLSLNMIGRKL
jgi:transposase